MLTRRYQRGDTLIEVLFAFSILSLIIVGSLTIMNQGSIAAQRALETTLVRQQIDAQATTLRFLHDAYVAKFQPGMTYDPATPAGQWALMANSLTATNATDFVGMTVCPLVPARGSMPAGPALPTGSFILDSVNARYISTSGGAFVAAPTVAGVTYQGSPQTIDQAQGIWIEGVRSVEDVDTNKQNTRFIDFHIMACWDSPGDGPPMTIGTIVRLYEPRG